MPSGDNWQGDVLRDLRGAGGQPLPEGQGPVGPDPQGVTPAQGPGPGGEFPAPDGHDPARPVPAAGPHQQQPVTGAGDGAYGYPYQTPATPTPPAQGRPAQAPAPYVPAPQTAAPRTPAPQHQAPQHQAPYPPQGHPADAGPRPARALDSRPAVDPGLVGARRKPRNGEPFLARAAGALWRTVSSSVAREVAEASGTAELLQQPVTTGRQIAVTSIRGGAGKSTVAALLGTTFAHYRQDPVLLVEADPALGSLPIRLGADSLRWTTGDVADIIEPQMSLLDVTGYLVQLRDNAWLLPGSQGQIGAMLDTRSYERAMVALRRYFGVTVVDCETLPAEVARVALSASQARVLTTPATLDGVASTYAVLQWMQGLPPYVIAGTVVVLTEQAAQAGIDVDEAVRTLRTTGASVHVLPHDRHLADGGPIRTDLLARATRTAATRIAADAFQLSQKRH
ncbi:MinD/ParA family protein [Streptomyces sp. A1136]|uniref:MinD/ParA family ATP-binding protein n=1 Tax=Streptomyces sp. A1136 TaxID=2563102 RepID=UPI00109E70DB|nr:MinD/ParA family protein [Streptomyces sp. A1136]THA55953.1 MinD/ParA family protein [Streptomyces sp. A1136]